MIKASVKGNLNFPSFFFQEDLRFIANRIIIPTLQNNIERELAVNETPLPALEPKTVERKIKAGLSPKILTATGQLKVSFIAIDKGKNSVVVTLAPNRKAIGGYLQIAGIQTKLGKKYFNFFGISSRMESSAMKYMRDKIKKAVKSAK